MPMRLEAVKLRTTPENPLEMGPLGRMSQTTRTSWVELKPTEGNQRRFTQSHVTEPINLNVLLALDPDDIDRDELLLRQSRLLFGSREVLTFASYSYINNISDSIEVKKALDRESKGLHFDPDLTQWETGPIDRNVNRFIMYALATGILPFQDPSSLIQYCQEKDIPMNLPSLLTAIRENVDIAAIQGLLKQKPEMQSLVEPYLEQLSMWELMISEYEMKVDPTGSHGLPFRTELGPEQSRVDDPRYLPHAAARLQDFYIDLSALVPEGEGFTADQLEKKWDAFRAYVANVIGRHGSFLSDPEKIDIIQSIRDLDPGFRWLFNFYRQNPHYIDRTKPKDEFGGKTLDPSAGIRSVYEIRDAIRASGGSANVEDLARQLRQFHSNLF